MTAILEELKRLEAGEQLGDELIETLAMIARIMVGMKEVS